MIRIYYPDVTLNQYKEFSPEEAIPIIEAALHYPRIVFNMSTNNRITSSENLDADAVIKVFPIVGGG